jgi:hypothetical protein
MEIMEIKLKKLEERERELKNYFQKSNVFQ